jgi:hypothetical protein
MPAHATRDAAARTDPVAHAPRLEGVQGTVHLGRT